jgi:hypothetical protein
MPVMRGVDYFPDPEHRDWAAHYDMKVRNFIRDRTTRVVGAPRDFIANPMTRDEYDAIYTRLIPEFQDWLRRHEREDAALWTVPELDVDALPEREFDRPKLTPFKLEYDTLQEVQMRFRQTVIQIKGNPFYVSDIRADRNNRQRYVFLTSDVADRNAQIALEKLTDMRSVPPGFVQLEGYSGWFARNPARVNQQGLNGQNVTCRRVSNGENVPLNIKSILKALDSKGKTTKWSPQYRDLMVNGVLSEMRLSDEVAVFRKKEDVYVAYRGRMFGKLTEGNLVTAMDEDDLIQPWIGKHFNKVELQVNA